MFTQTFSTAGNSPAGLRHHPQIETLLKQAESRQLTPPELESFQAAAPAAAERVDAAREIAAVEKEVVQKTVNEIFSVFPFVKQHGDYAPSKCERDVGYVSAYATHAMLIDDPQWLNDKMLYWMRTIVQAFSFPDTPTEVKSSLFGPKQNRELSKVVEQSNQFVGYTRAIYATYTRLGQNYQAALSPAAWQLLQPLLQQTVDVLTSE